MKFYFEFPYYFLIPAALFAAGLTFLLYRKDKLFRDISKKAVSIMAILRFLFIFTITVLLLNPIYKSKKKTFLKPIIVVAQDNSKSIALNNDSLFYKTEYPKLLNNFINNLSSDFEVKLLLFDEYASQDTSIDFTGNLTNISNVFQDIITRYSGLNLGAIILSSDGIFNSGINPIYSSLPNVPIYTIALGDTISQKDLKINDVIANKVAFIGNKFPARINVSAEKCPEKNAQISIYLNNKQVFKNSFEIPKDGTKKFIDVEIPAEKTGINLYEVTITNLDNEISYENNKFSFNINVIDNRNKILILYDGIHPDIGAIKFALKNNPDYELQISDINEFKGDLTNQNLVILYQLPSKKNNISEILRAINKNKIPVLYILGLNSSLQDFNKLKTGVEIINKTQKYEDVTPSLNSNFTSFDPALDENNFIKKLSPLKSFFGDYIFNDNVKILLFQNINGIRTSKPLLVFIESQYQKTGIIFGEGIWRWRMDDFKFNNSHTNFVNLINKTVQYLVVKKLANKLNLEYKSVYTENEEIIIDASFIDETYEIVKNLDIKLKLVTEDNKEFNYIFNDNNNGYRLNMGRLPVGRYKIIAETKFEGKTYSENGEFIVEKISLEYQDTKANHFILNALSEKSGGKMYFPKQIDQLAKDVQNNKNIVTLAYEEEKLNTITDLTWIFFIILLFAATEWSLRKYFGGY